MKMRTSIRKFDLYVGNIESNMLTIPKTERDRFLEELVDILLQQFEDFCTKYKFSKEDNSAAELFLQTIDPPEVVAKDFTKNYTGESSHLHSFLTRWIRIEKFIVERPILGALLIGGFFYGIFPLIILLFFVLASGLFLILARLFLSVYFHQISYYTYSLFSLLNPFIKAVLAFFSCISFIVISWRILGQDNNLKKSCVFMIISLLTYSVLILLENLINLKQINFSNVLIYNLPDKLDPVVIVLNIIVLAFVISILGALIIIIILNRVNHIEKMSNIFTKRSLVFIVILVFLITVGIISLGLWQVMTPKLFFAVERVPLNEIQDEEWFTVYEESYSPTLSFSQFLKTYCEAEDHLNLDIDIQGGSIIITETYDSEQALTQICPYSISGSIEPIQTGTYNFTVIFIDKFLNKTDILYEMTVNFTWLSD